MARTRAVDTAPFSLRAHLAGRLRQLIADYEHSPDIVRHWQREADRIEAGEGVTFYGWQARPLGLPPNGRFRLTADDQIEPDRPSPHGKRDT